jgi:hypothetical protein
VNYTAIEVPGLHSRSHMVEWMLTTADPIGQWFKNIPGNIISIELTGITWGGAIVTVQGSNRSFVVAFTSGGTFEVIPGHTITGATSGATAKIRSVNLNTSGTWAGGTAAGDFILEPGSIKGVFTSENLNVGANLNVATIAGDVGSSSVYTLSDIEGFEISYGTGNNGIYQIQENTELIRPNLTTVGTGAFVLATLHSSIPVSAIKI